MQKRAGTQKMRHVTRDTMASTSGTVYTIWTSSCSVNRIDSLGITPVLVIMSEFYPHIHRLNHDPEVRHVPQFATSLNK